MDPRAGTPGGRFMAESLRGLWGNRRLFFPLSVQTFCGEVWRHVFIMLFCIGIYWVYHLDNTYIYIYIHIYVIVYIYDIYI